MYICIYVYMYICIYVYMYILYIYAYISFDYTSICNMCLPVKKRVILIKNSEVNIV